VNPIRVVLADDQRMFREAIRTLLARHADLDVVAEAGTGEQVLAAVAAHLPDVVVLDIEMPDGDGLTVAGRLHAVHPRTRCLIVTTYGRPGYLRRALESRVAGFVLKDSPADALADAIRRTAAGERVIDPGLAAAARRTGASPLTPGEREVLRATTTGCSVHQIAGALHLAEGTVRNRISTAITKLHARNRTDAARIATDNGWL
jgi:two-component system, NarL family, response regulator DesR